MPMTGPLISSAENALGAQKSAKKAAKKVKVRAKRVRKQMGNVFDRGDRA